MRLLDAHPRAKVALTILFHSSCAIWSTLISKSALNSLDAPILLLALQFSVQVILLTAIGVPTGWIKPIKPWKTWKSILPLTIARLTGILAKTFCLAAVDAAFYQIARGLLLPFTLLLSLAILRPIPYFPPLSLAGAGCVMLGFVAGLSNDFGAHLTGIKGIVLGVGSSFTTAVESVVVKRYLSPSKKKAVADASGDENDGDELGVWQMVWMSNVLALLFYIPLLILSGDMRTLGHMVLPAGWVVSADPIDAGTAAVVSRAAEAAAAAAGAGAQEGGMGFLQLAFLTGLAGFLLTIATFMQIDVTSPTTHMIVTASRGVAQSALAALILHEPMTAGRVSSMGLILGGSALYGWAKDRALSGKREGYKVVEGSEEERRRDEDIEMSLDKEKHNP